MSANEPGFSGRTVLVVGGGQGIGRQYCLDLSRAGARVVVASRSDTAVAVAEEIRAGGGEAAEVVADVRDGMAVVGGALEKFGTIDAMILNAGIVRDRSFAKMSREEWDEVLDVHLNGAFACAKAAWEPLSSAGNGAILFTSSGAGFHGAFGQANYAAAKAGVIGFAKSLAIEGKRKGIRVNVIAPMASTGMTAGVFSEELKTGLTAENLSPYALALIHPSCSLSGEVIEAGGGWAAAMRWERSLGSRTSDFDFAEALSLLPEVVDFDRGYDHPKTTIDALDAALGRDRIIVK